MTSEMDSAGGGKEENGGPDAVTALTTSQRVLQYFWDMASFDENCRVTAARSLVKDLTEEQTKHLSTLGKDTETPPNAETPKIKLLEYHLQRCSPTMVYALRRLARGLASSRQAARQGYASALAGLLSANHCITPAGFQVLLEVCIDGPRKGGDAKDTLLGWLFGYGALLRSGTPMDPSTRAAVFSEVLKHGQAKSFLRECATVVAVEAVRHMDAEAIAAVTAPGQPLVAMLQVAPAEATPEALLLALVLWPKLPAGVLQGCRLLPANTPPAPPELFFGTRGDGMLSSATSAAITATAAGIFSREHLQVLLPALLGTSGSHPRMHTLWQYLLVLLLPGFRLHRNVDLLDVSAGPGGGETADPAGGATARADAASGAAEDKKALKAAAKAAKSPEGKGTVNAALLEAFWSVVVEGGLMNSSHERRYLGFQLFSRVLPYLRAEHVPCIFSPGFTRTLVSAVQHPDNYLHASAKKLLDGLKSFMGRSNNPVDSDLKVAVAVALQRLGGGLSGKQIKSSNLTQTLVKGLDTDGVHRYVSALMDAFLKGTLPLQPGDGLQELREHAAEANGHGAAEGEEVARLVTERRNQCLEQLMVALKVPNRPQADYEAAMRFLALHAFVEVKSRGDKASKSKLVEVKQAAQQLTIPLTPATRATCASRLIVALSNSCHSVFSRPRTAKRQLSTASTRVVDGAAEGSTAADQPATKKRKMSAGDADALAAAATTTTMDAPHLLTNYQQIHDTLLYIRKLLKAPYVTPVVALGEEGENALQLLAAIETASLERLADLEKARQSQDKHAGCSANTLAAVRVLAALAAHLQLQLLADPEGFEMDLPLSLRRIAAEGLGVPGLPDVEEEEEEAGGGEGNEGETAKPAGRWQDVLVDVMLALMARPGGAVPIAPLRLVAEAVWRSTCEGMSAEGLADIVRVVAAGGKGEGQSTVGLFESDDEEEEEGEDQEDAKGSESDSDAETADQQEPKEGGATKGKEGRKHASAPGTSRKRRKAGEDSDRGGSELDSEEGDGKEGGRGGSGKGSSGDGGGAGGGTEDDSESEDGDGDDADGMDDEAMFRMDEKLAAYFRSMVGGRAGSVAASERAEALRHFRLRSLGLLAAFARKVPNSPLLLTCLEPLLRVLATASRSGGQPDLAKMLHKVIVEASSKCKSLVDLAVLGGLEGYMTTLKRLLYEASRNRDKQVAGAAWQAYTAVLRAGAKAEAKEPEVASAARASFRIAVSDLLTKKKTRLQPEELLAAFQSAPTACLPCLDVLLQHVATGRNGSVRVAAAELLARLFKCRPEGLAAALTIGAPAGIGGALGGALAACTAGVGLRTQQHLRAIQAAISVAESLKRLKLNKRAAEVMGSDKINLIAKAVVTVKGLEPAPKVDKALARLVNVMALDPLIGKTNSDPALVARIEKGRPDSGAAKAAGKSEGAGKEAANGKRGRKAAQEGAKWERTRDEARKKGHAKRGDDEDAEMGDGDNHPSNSGSDGDSEDSSEGPVTVASGSESESEGTSSSGGEEGDSSEGNTEEGSSDGEERAAGAGKWSRGAAVRGGGQGRGRGRGRGKGGRSGQQHQGRGNAGKSPKVAKKARQ